MTTTDNSRPTPIAEVGEDFTEALTIQEIGIVARQIGVDPLGEIDRGGPKNWEAMARLGWVLDRRRDQTAKVEAWLGLTIPQLLTALGIPEDDTPAAKDARAAARQAADDVDPTASAPA